LRKKNAPRIGNGVEKYNPGKAMNYGKIFANFHRKKIVRKNVENIISGHIFSK